MAKFLLGFKHMLSKHAILLCKISTTFITNMELNVMTYSRSLGKVFEPDW